VSRRSFLKVCATAAAAVGLPSWAGEAMAKEMEAGGKPSVIWLHFQECTGCTESLLRTSQPDVAELILDLVSMDYHETLFAAAGHQIEHALEEAIEKNKGKYILVVEGAIPTKDGGVYCQVAGEKSIDALNRVAKDAGLVVAIGSCASWGGVASADPNPTGAVGVPDILKGQTVVTLPGCPANPYNLLGTVLQFATFGTLPELDELGRPKFAYARVIHEDCPRRPHFDAGRFAEQFGDEGHRLGYCLFKLGCKGPVTHSNCSLESFCELPNSWPVGIGHPCFGCTEKGVGFHQPLHAMVSDKVNEFPPAVVEQSSIAPATIGVGGVIGGAIVGAAAVAAKKVSAQAKFEEEASE